MTIMLMRRIAARARLLVAAGSLLASASLTAVPAFAQQLGPAPTAQSTTVDGPFAIASETVGTLSTPLSVGDVTIWYPTSTAQTYGAIAMAPGWLFGRGYLDWYGKRLASHGFVVISVDPNTVLDFPSARATALIDALDWLVKSSSVKNRVDPKRLGVLGHSMGGGATLEASVRRPTLKAAMALEPYHDTKIFNTAVPVAILGGENDTNASPAEHAEPMYAGMTANEKAYLELNNADHFAPASDNPTISTFVLSWAKRWIDGDTRYTKFLCPGPAVDQVLIEEYRSTCPY